MKILLIDEKTTEFVLHDPLTKKDVRFHGTVDGAIAFNFVGAKEDYVSMSSDLNHPDDFPKFEEHSIDIAAGYLDGAVEAGIIKLGD